MGHESAKKNAAATALSQKPPPLPLPPPSRVSLAHLLEAGFEVQQQPNDAGPALVAGNHKRRCLRDIHAPFKQKSTHGSPLPPFPISTYFYLFFLLRPFNCTRDKNCNDAPRRWFELQCPLFFLAEDAPHQRGLSLPRSEVPWPVDALQ